MNNIEKLYNSWQTVFWKKNLKNYLNFNTDKALDLFLYRAKKKGILNNIFYGIYSFKKYNIFELACKIRKKSYISLETVLKDKWVIFQYYDTIFLISDDTLEKNIDNNIFKFNKIKDSILLNQLWIVHNWNYTIATVERAICDRIYLSKNYYFDDLSGVNFELLKEVSEIYNKRVILEVNKLIKKYA